MKLSKYFRGETSLSSAVVLNIIVVSLLGAIVEYMISKEYLHRITSIKTLSDLWNVLAYYIAVLPFDYVVWVCAHNAKRKMYFILGRLFALKHNIIFAAVDFSKY